MSKRASRAKALWPFLASIAALTVPAGPALGDITFTPGVTVRQVVSDNFSDNRGMRGWLETGAFFDLQLDTRRVQGNISYSYGHRFKEFGNVLRNDRHDANANVRSILVDDFLYLDLGGIARQFASDQRGFTSLNGDVDSGNQTQIFSGYVEPFINYEIGTFALFNARYRFAATSASGPNADRGIPANIGLEPGEALGAMLSDSVTHSGGVSVASQRENNRFNWTFAGNFIREDIDELDQKYRNYRGVADFGFRVNRSIELLGSVGYEDILNTQNSILFDPITGLPVLDAEGNLQIDPANPRRTAYDQQGLTYDGGFRWTPSRRSELMVRAGKRFGGFTLAADLRFEARGGLVVVGNWDESLDSIGRLLSQYQNGNLIGATRISGFMDEAGIPLCILGFDPVTETCLLGLTQSITPATFKLDRGTLGVSMQSGTFGGYAGANYERRQYVDSQQLQVPGQPQLPPAAALGDDISYGLRGSLSFGQVEGGNLTFNAMVARNKYALSRNRHDTTALVGANYLMPISSNLSATASAYVSKRFSNTADDGGSLTGALGLRYTF
jgi:hypothetical protein